MQLVRHIEDECHKLILRHQRALVGAHTRRDRYHRATGLKPAKPTHNTPPHWTASSAFNPYRVKKRVSRIAPAIENALHSGEYQPHPALIIDVPKPGGGKRQISIYPIADAAVASMYYRRILRRNETRLSPFSYAYRRDVRVHDAIERLAREIRERNHWYVIEFDFSKYFDTISHAYVIEILHRYFRLTGLEHQVVLQVLRARRAFGLDQYKAAAFKPTPHGIPQGNSLSLFLANVACHELDLDLSRNGITFARYADDILALCSGNAQVDVARERIMDHCKKAGLSINFDKSEGVSEFGPEGVSSIAASSPRTKAAVDYLGHRISFRSVWPSHNPTSRVVRRLSIRPASEARIRRKLSNIIFSHLISYPSRGEFNPSRFSFGVDWDLVTCINDLRGYIYGGLSEDHIRNALSDKTVRLHVSEGVLAFFPLINDVEQLKGLDGWLVHATASALSKRYQIIHSLGGLTPPMTHTTQTLLTGTWYKEQTISNDVRMPSFVRSWKYSARCLRAFDLARFPTHVKGASDDDLY